MGEATGSGGIVGFSMASVAFCLVTMLLCDSAGLLLITGRRAGRILAILFSGAVLLVSGAGFFAFLVQDGITIPGVVLLGGPLVAFGVALGCASAGSTGRWVGYCRHPGPRNAGSRAR